MIPLIKHIKADGFDKEVISRFLVILAIIIVAAIVAQGVLEELMGPAIAVVAIGLTLTSSLPRWLMLWYERRNFLIEATFSGLFYYLSGAAGGIGFVTFSSLVAGIVSVVKLINNRTGQVYGRTLFQYLCTYRTVYWIFGSAPGPLDDEWRWPSKQLATGYYQFEKQGFMDWKYLIACWTNRHDPNYNFFQYVSMDLPPAPSRWTKLVDAHGYFEQKNAYERQIERLELHEQLVEKGIGLQKQIDTLTDNKPKGDLKGWINSLKALQDELDKTNNEIREV